MPWEVATPLLGGFIAVLGGVAGTRWGQRRALAEDDARAVRKVARELYRELDSASRRLSEIEGARTYGELWRAMPTIRRWSKLRVTLADHALELIWMELAYTIDRMLSVSKDLREAIWLEDVASTDPLPAGKQRKIRCLFEEGMRATLGILEVLLPSDTPSRASQRLGPPADVREQGKIQQQQSLVRRELARAKPRGRLKAIARFWESIWGLP